MDFEVERSEKAALRESMESSHFSQSEARRAVEALQARAATLQREVDEARKATMQSEMRSEEVRPYAAFCVLGGPVPLFQSDLSIRY